MNSKSNTKKWIDKKTATTFKVVHRSHLDARFYDDEASPTVLIPINEKNGAKDDGQNSNNISKIRLETKNELLVIEKELKDNEGKSAAYGVTYDDSEYDYLQHLKPIGESNDGVFIAKKDKNEEKKNNKIKSKSGFKLKELLGDDIFASQNTKAYNYQSQQDIPDEIKGFKPNLNEDLKEALVALEDENYLDEEQDVDEIDVFGELLGSSSKKQELSLMEYDQKAYYEDQDQDWDYDEYDGDYNEYDDKKEENEDFDWEKDFNKFKTKQSKKTNEWDSDDEFSAAEDDSVEADVVGELPNINSENLKSSKSTKKKEKRKKGSLTDTSSYSMTSSALCRTEQLSIIDDKFDVMKEKYENEALDDDEDEDYQPFDFDNERPDFMEMVDDFLDNYQLEKRGKRVVKKNNELESYKNAALSASKGKMADKRKKDLGNNISDLKDLTRDVSDMTI